MTTWSTRGFLSCVQRDTSVSAEGRSHEQRSREKIVSVRHYQHLTETGNCALDVSSTHNIL